MWEGDDQDEKREDKKYTFRHWDAIPCQIIIIAGHTLHTHISLPSIYQRRQPFKWKKISFTHF